MRERKFRVAGRIAVCLCALFLAGCSGEKTVSAPETAEESGEQERYEKRVVELKLPSDQELFSDTFAVSGGYLYFAAEEGKEENGEYRVRRNIYRISCREGAAAELYYTCEEDFFLDYTPVAEEDGVCVYVLSGDGDNYIIRRVDPAGRAADPVILQDAVDPERRMSHIAVNGEQGYLLWGNEQIAAISKEGVCLKTTSCPGEGFRRVQRLQDGRAAVTYMGEGDQMFLIFWDAETGKCTEPVSVPAQELSGVGNDVFLYDTGHVYRLDEQTKKVRLCLTLQEYDLPGQWNKGVFANAGGLDIVSYDETSAGSVRILTLYPYGTAPDAAAESGSAAREKQVVTLYTGTPEMLSMGITDEMIAAFNLESSDYTVKIYEGKQTLDAVFAQGEQPDILFEFVPDKMADYIANGYLEDLWPYIDRSEQLDRDDCHEVIRSCFEEDGKLYAIPRSACIESLLGRTSQMSGQGSWSVSEFLGWLEEHPDARNVWGLNAGAVLEYCLRGNMEAYVDFASGSAHFDTPEFCDTLERIASLPTEGNQGVFLSLNATGDISYEELVYLYDANLNYLYQIAEMEFLFGESLIDMGLPSDGGGKKAILTPYSNFAVFGNSACKEGAYAFIEFCLLYEPAVTAGQNANGAYWTVDSVRDLDVGRTMGERRMSYLLNGAETEIAYEITEQDKELFLGLLDHAVAETKVMRKIRDIVSEETQPFFAGQTEAAAACEKIQNRVQLLLNEN